MSPRKLANFRLDDDLIAGLKAVQARDGMPQAEQVRRALRAGLKARGVDDVVPQKKTAHKREAPRKRA